MNNTDMTAYIMDPRHAQADPAARPPGERTFILRDDGGWITVDVGPVTVHHHDADMLDEIAAQFHAAATRLREYNAASVYSVEHPNNDWYVVRTYPDGVAINVAGPFPSSDKALDALLDVTAPDSDAAA